MSIDLKERRKGIGGSDIGAIAGLCQYRTPMDVWLSKTGRREDGATSEAARWGQLLEDPIAQRYAEVTGRTVTSHPYTLVDPERSWHRGNVDRDSRSGDDWRILEIKTAGFRMASKWGEAGTDEMPADYLAQVQWYLSLVEDCAVADVAVLIAGQDFRIYSVPRDEALQAALLEIGERFWVDHVLADVPPAVDASEACREWLQRQYPRHVAPLLQATPAADEIAARLRDARARKAKAEADEEQAGNELRALIGSAEGIAGNGWRVSWKSSERKTTDWKAVAQALEVEPAIVKEHTKVTTVRAFRPTFSEEQ